MTSYLRRKRVPTRDTYCCESPNRWWRYWFTFQFYWILSRSRDFLRPTNGRKFILLWLLMGCLSVVQADLNDGSVSSYPFDDGNAFDIVGGHDGTVYGATLTTDSSGKANGAFYFDKGGERIKVGHSSAFDMSHELTLSACVKSSKMKKRNQTIIAKNGKDGGFALNLGTTHGGITGKRYTFCFLIGLKGDKHNGARKICGDKHYNSDHWYHVAGVYKNGTATIYVDGRPEHSKTFKHATSIKNNKKNLIIGNHKNVKRFYGAIDDVRIYNRALSGSEIGELACGGSSSTQEPINRPPELKNISPALGTVVQEFDNLTLKWTGTDPDDDPLTYKVSFGETLPLNTLSENISQATYSVPYLLEPDKLCFWQVEANDGQNTTIETWGFKTKSNNPPHEPSNPQPEDGAGTVNYSNFEFTWSWAGDGQADPDGDQVTYDVYWSEDKSTLNNLSGLATACPNVPSTIAACPVALDPDKTYYWRVVAKDEHDLSTKGYFWQFKTQSFNAVFRVNYSRGVAPFPVTFTDASVGDIRTWAWDFGVQNPNGTGNETSAEQNPTFTFNEPGIYTVILTIEDGDGEEKSIEMPITVNELELVPLIVRPGADTMYLDWSTESINTYILEPTNTIIEFRRAPEGTEDWQLVDTKDYMDSLISANQYFDGNAIEPKMVKEQKYCYFFRVLVGKDDNTNLLTESEKTCETFGAVRLFIDKVASAAHGNQVVIPVKIANAQDLKISNGNLSIMFNKNVISPEDMTVVLSPLLKDTNGDALYEFGTPSVEEDGDYATVTFPFDGNLDDELFGGLENFFWIKGTVKGNNGDETGLNWDENPDKSFMKDYLSTDISLSFGNADFSIRKGNRLRDSKSTLVADGSFTVDASGRLGDPNLNAVVDPDDVKHVLRYIVDKETYPLSENQLAAADANGNGKIEASDAALISYYSFKGEWPSIGSSQSAQNDSPMELKLGDISGESGAETETVLNVENLSDFTGGEFILSYDPAVVEGITEVKRTSFTKRFTILFHDNGEGKVRIAMASREPINGSGELVSVKLRLKSKTTLRKRTRDGAAIGKRSASLVLAQTQFYDPVGRNFVTSKLQRTVERKNAEVVRTDVVEDGDDTSTGTGDNSTPNDDPTVSKLPKVSGQILDKVGDPIVNATIQVGDKTVITDETGSWEIVEMAQGEYTVTASKTDYTFVPQTITVENDNLIINIKEVVETNDSGGGDNGEVDNDSVMNVYTASGFVLDQDAEPKAGVSVRVGNKTAITDNTGYWVVLGLESGEYTVSPFQDHRPIALPETCVVDTQQKCKLTFIEEESFGEYRVSGTIRDEFGNPIEDIAVEVAEIITFTDAAGNWEINRLVP